MFWGHGHVTHREIISGVFSELADNWEAIFYVAAWTFFFYLETKENEEKIA